MAVSFMPAGPAMAAAGRDLKDFKTKCQEGRTAKSDAEITKKGAELTLKP